MKNIQHNLSCVKIVFIQHHHIQTTHKQNDIQEAFEVDKFVNNFYFWYHMCAFDRHLSITFKILLFLFLLKCFYLNNIKSPC